MPNFTSDYSKSNPKIHKLYVRMALETLDIAIPAAEELEELSRFPANFIAGKIREEIREHALVDAAWFEACALRAIHADTSSYFQDMDELSRPT